VRGICAKPQVKCGQCPHQAFVPLSGDIIAKHLRGGSAGSGNYVAGVYPLLADGTCWFLAADFDKQDWIINGATSTHILKLDNPHLTAIGRAVMIG